VLGPSKADEQIVCRSAHQPETSQKHNNYEGFARIYGYGKAAKNGFI
jgi:hypothetical protein